MTFFQSGWVCFRPGRDICNTKQSQLGAGANMSMTNRNLRDLGHQLDVFRRKTAALVTNIIRNQVS